MNRYQRVKIFFYKLIHWEYWSVWIIYLPCLIAYPYYAFRSGYSLFFTAANPGIRYGGAFLASKKEIQNKISARHLPATLFIDQGISLDKCISFIEDNSLSFPLILKPDMGLRGLGLYILQDADDLEKCLKTIDKPYMLQEFIHYENEIGIFVIKNRQKSYEITSIVAREFMTLKGDGMSSLEQLVLANPRYTMQYRWIFGVIGLDKNIVLEEGVLYKLPKIGNHSRGTVFRNGNHLINDDLHAVINNVMLGIQGFNYGRLDIKYQSLEQLYTGQHFNVIELNGVFSEPAHIYDPDNSLIQAWKDLLIHFKYLFDISKTGISNGFIPLSFSEGIKKLYLHFQTTRRL